MLRERASERHVSTVGAVRRSAVISLPVPDLQNKHLPIAIVHFVDDPVIPNPNTPLLFPILEFAASRWTRILGKASNGGTTRCCAFAGSRATCFCTLRGTSTA